MTKLLVIWFNPNKKNYYYTIVNNFSSDYFVGKKNQYSHEVVLTLPIQKLIHNNSYRRFKKNVYRSIISTLEKKINKL